VDDIRTDAQRLGQIMKNLLSNAFKFTDVGSVKVSIDRPAPGAITAPPAPHPIRVVVTDTGIGIPTDKQKLIFEAFQQADGTTSRKHGGTGLGLSISRELAKLLGGEIRLTSEPGKGSTFTLLLPVAVVASEKADDTAEGPSSAETTPGGAVPDGGTTVAEPPLTRDQALVAPEASLGIPGGQRQDAVEPIPDDRKTTTPDDKSILIIEDDPTFARIMLELVRERDFKGIVADTGEAGLHLADYYRPSAILLDIQLPGMDGLAVMDHLKEDVATRHIPIHVISGREDELDAYKRGAIGYLHKPIAMDSLDKDVFAPIERLLAGGVRNLLVVDDDDATRTSITALLEAKDVKIVTAATGKDAIAKLSTQPFDCMVLDLRLPDMPGTGVLEHIKITDSLAHIPVIVFTGKDLTGAERASLDKYAERIIVKGVKSQERLLDETALFLHRVDADLPEEKQQVIRMLHDKEAIFKDKKVLIVDDDMRNVFALSSVLEDKGMEPLPARNGQEALDMLATRRDIDLVLMDIMMPVMDGYEAMKRIRQTKHEIVEGEGAGKQASRIPIIALTAKAMKGDRAKCIEAGANDYLAKPVDTDKLMSMLRVWLYM
jgi:CheY-like chemotaxis protein